MTFGRKYILTLTLMTLAYWLVCSIYTLLVFGGLIAIYNAKMPGWIVLVYTWFTLGGPMLFAWLLYIHNKYLSSEEDASKVLHEQAIREKDLLLADNAAQIVRLQDSLGRLMVAATTSAPIPAAAMTPASTPAATVSATRRPSRARSAIVTP